MSLLLAKAGVGGTSVPATRILLRNQTRTAYDIHLVHWSFVSGSIVGIDDPVSACLSTRLEDQEDNDLAIVVAAEMLTENNLFLPFMLSMDVETEGAVGMVGNHTIPFAAAKPFRVPLLAVAFFMAVTATSNLGVEVYFERVQVSSAELASLMARVGARTETS